MKGTTMVKVIQTSIHLTYDVARIELEIPMKLRCDYRDSFKLIKKRFDQGMVKTATAATSKTTISTATIKAHKDARTRRTVRLTWTTRSGNSSTNVWEARLKNNDFVLPHFDFDPLFFKT